MGAVEVRAAEFGSPEQLAAIELRRRVLRRPLGLDFTAEQLAAEVSEFHLVALLDSAVVGCLVLTPLDGGEIKMRQVAVEPALQGQGIGTEMVAFSESFVRSRGFSRMVLNARDTAVAFYLGLGYEIVGEPFVEVTIPHRRMKKAL